MSDRTPEDGSQEAAWLQSVETKHRRRARRADHGAFIEPRSPPVPRQGRAAPRPRGGGPRVTPHSFQLVNVAYAQAGQRARRGKAQQFRFAYISDSHLYERNLNDRFIPILKAVDDVNAMDPQPDFVFFGGRSAARSGPSSGAQIRKRSGTPLKMMVGEHDWFLDMGEVAGSVWPADYSWTIGRGPPRGPQ